VDSSLQIKWKIRGSGLIIPTLDFLEGRQWPVFRTLYTCICNDSITALNLHHSLNALCPMILLRIEPRNHSDYILLGGACLLHLMITLMNVDLVYARRVYPEKTG
jgi:hypothetical protein